MQIIRKYQTYIKEAFFLSACAFSLCIFPVFSFAQAPYVPTPVSQPLTQPLGATPYVPTPVSQPLTQPLAQPLATPTTGTTSTPSTQQANLHSNTNVNTQPLSQAQSMTIPNSTGLNTPITMTVTTNINNPQTQTVPVHNTATAPLHLQNQNTVAPLLTPQNQPCPPAQIQNTAHAQQMTRASQPYGSLCSPSLERNLYLTSTYDMLVPRRHLYSQDPALTSKPEPKIYTRNPLVRKEQVAYFQPEYSSTALIGSSNKKTSNQALNAQIRQRERQQLERQFNINEYGERVIVYPVINRGDGVRALGIIQSSNSNKNKNTAQNTTQVTAENVAATPQIDKEAANTALQEIKASESASRAQTEISLNIEEREEIQK